MIGMSSRPRAMLFDMDGTLTRPLLDFPTIKREMGIGNRPILEALAAMSAQERLMAEAILHRHEDQAAGRATLNEGCRAVLQWLADQRIPTAVITRNSRRSAATVFELHGLKTDLLLTRDDDHLPFKPDPAPLLHACTHLGVSPGEAWMVGDGEFDILAGTRAGTTTVWISHGQPRPFQATPSQTVADLPQLLRLLEQVF